MERDFVINTDKMILDGQDLSKPCIKVKFKEASTDYHRLKELLDKGLKVPVLIQIRPYPCDKINVLASAVVDNEKKGYDIGYGIVFDTEAFFRQCEGLKLEYFEKK